MLAFAVQKMAEEVPLLSLQPIILIEILHCFFSFAGKLFKCQVKGKHPLGRASQF